MYNNTPFFDVRDLDEHELGHLEYVLNSPSWERVFEPYLRKISDGMTTKLKDPSTARKDQYPDDFLRGGIATVDGLLAFIHKIVAETQMDRIAAARTHDAESEYHRLQQAGLIGGPNVPEPEGYDPDEF